MKVKTLYTNCLAQMITDGCLGMCIRHAPLFGMLSAFIYDRISTKTKQAEKNFIANDCIFRQHELVIRQCKTVFVCMFSKGIDIACTRQSYYVGARRQDLSKID